MLITLRTLSLTGLLAVSSMAAGADTAPQLGKAPLSEVIAALTLEEKASLVRGAGMTLPGAEEDLTEQGPVVGNVEKERVPGAAGATLAVPRLGIPSMTLADGPAGVRIAPIREDEPDHSYYATAFPIATLLASTWDLQLVESVGKAMGSEAKEYGVDILLGPGLNLQRYALGGRNFEYYSEDPYLTGRMAAAMTRGIQSQGVGASLKHFVANNHEWNRTKMDVRVAEKTLRDIYLKGFEIAVKESRPWTIMSSFNKVNGVYTSESYQLLTEILRGEWGFAGFVMTDWFGGAEAPAQIAAGNDLLMPGLDQQAERIISAVRDGSLAEAALDRSVADILRIIMKTPIFQGYQHTDQPDLEANARIARRAAAEGMILLRNQGNVLPLPAGARLALFGNASYQMVTGGTGSGDVNEAYSISLQEGLEGKGYATASALAPRYREYIAAENSKYAHLDFMERMLGLPRTPELPVSEAAISAAAEASDAALIAISRNSGEFNDRDEADFSLYDDERQLMDSISATFRSLGKPVVVVLNIGGPIETVSWREQADAILLAWQPGQEAGHAVADLLSGDVSPSGRLAVTFPARLHDVPAAAGFPGLVDDPNEVTGSDLTGHQAATIVYDDGENVGYRHFNGAGPEAAYPFGFGLSYSEFAYSQIEVGEVDEDGAVNISLSVTNNGDYPAREVVQVYVRKADDAAAAVLRAFGKTGILQPGESAALQMTVAVEQLAEFSPALGENALAPGDYEFSVGTSSVDILERRTVALR